MAPEEPGTAVPDQPAEQWEQAQRSRPLAERAAEATKAQYDLVIRWIMGNCGVDWHKAEDLLQDVHLRIAERGISADPEFVLRYLAVSARNRHLDLVRKAARDQANAAETAGLTPQYLLGDGDRTLNDVAVRTLMLDAFDDLDTLPRKERTAVVLRHYFGFSVAAIAEEMDLTSKQVENLLQQARARFARHRAVREQSTAYAILAMILRPVRDSASTVGGPIATGFSTFAAAVAFSVVTATTGGVPVTADLPSPVHAAVSAIPPLAPPTFVGPGPHTTGRFVGVLLGGSADPARALSPRRLTQHLHVPPTCTDHLCFGTGPHGTGRPGDTVTVTVAGRDLVYATEDVTPVCEHVPATSTPAASTRCDRQEPDEWRVKDVPPAPSHGGPS